MQLAAKQESLIEKTRELIVSSCQKGFYGAIEVKIEDGKIVHVFRKQGWKPPFEIKNPEKKLQKNGFCDR